MKRFFLGTLFVLMVMAPVVLNAQTTVLKFSQDGEFASVSQSTDPNSSFSVTVSRNSSTGTTATASLSYASFSFDPSTSTQTVTQIVGAIPAADFTGQSTQSLTLNFNTSDLDPTNSFSQTCTLDLTDLTNSTCGPVTAGSISLTFTQNGVSRARVFALGEEITIGNFTTRIHQRSDNSSANVSGSIFGASVSGSGATVGVNHNSSLELIKN